MAFSRKEGVTACTPLYNEPTIQFGVLTRLGVFVDMLISRRTGIRNQEPGIVKLERANWSSYR